MDCMDIIIKYLKENGYDGLCNSEIPCGCGLADLAPCCDNINECSPAYLQKNKNCKICESSVCDYRGTDEKVIDCFSPKKP